MRDAESQAPGSPAESESTLSLSPGNSNACSSLRNAALDFMKPSTLPCEQSRSSFFPQLHRAIQIKKNKQKKKTKQNKKTLPNVANGHFERSASQVPSSKPKRPHFGGGDNKGEVWHVCLCLSLQSPRGGWTHCYAFRGCLINMGWLADQPRCENKVCLSLSWGRWTYRTISCDLGRAVPSRLDYRL